MKLVKVAKLGARVREVSLEDEKPTKVTDALRAADVFTEGFELRVNNRTADGNTSVSNGDIITLVPAVRGGSTL